MAITVDINQIVCSDEIKAKLNNLKLFPSKTDEDLFNKLEELEKQEAENNGFIQKMKLASAMQLQHIHGLALEIGENPEKAKSIKTGHKLLYDIESNNKNLKLMDKFADSFSKP